MAYVECGNEGVGPEVEGAESAGVEAALGGGMSENNDGEGAMNDRYWSSTWSDYEEHGQR